jgi:hypothetical protein
MYNSWYLSHDDTFANRFCADSPSPLQAVATRPCSCCKNILAENHLDKAFGLKLADILASAEQCGICNLLVRAFLDDVRDDGIINLFRTNAALRAGTGGRRLVRFSTDTSKHSMHNSLI